MPSGSRNWGRKCWAISSDTNGASQPFLFQLMKCDASELLITSQAWMPEANSWSSRWNSRSAPERSICTAMPGYFASNALPSFSPTGRSMAEYRITLPSLLAASTSSGVIATGGGASARAGEANTAPSANAVVPFKTFRLENFLAIIVSSMLLSAQRAAAFRRQRQPDLGAPANRVFGRRHHPQGGAVQGLDHVVAAGAEKHLPRHGGLDRILGRRGGLRRQLDVVLADRDHGPLAGHEPGADHLQRRPGKRDVVGVAGGAVDHIAGADEARDEFRL